MRGFMLSAFIAAVVPAAAASAQPSAAPAPRQCFFLRDWEGSRVTPDDAAAYIRVRHNDIYRLDFTKGGCPGASEPWRHLVNRGFTDTVCSPLDLDVKVTDPNGFSAGCVVSKITPLSKDEAAALPKKLLP